MHDDESEQPGQRAPGIPSSEPSAAPSPVSPPPPSPPPPAPDATPATPLSTPAWPLPPADPAGRPGPGSLTGHDPFAPPSPPTDPLTPPAPPLDLPAPEPGGGALPPPLGALAPATTTTPPEGPTRPRSWLAVVVVAALIGGGVGAGVTAIADNNNGTSNDNVTIHESNAAPGAAIVNGNVNVVQLVKKVDPSVVSIDVKSGQNEDQGTGMIISSDGEVITNNHVILIYVQGGNTGSITVTEYGQTKSEAASLVGYDTAKDVALLKIDNASNLPTVTFGNSNKAQVGDYVVAIGNALGLAAGTPTVTQGIISALGRSVTAGGVGATSENLQNLMQTDAAINPGNSGGPLIDTQGQVIGMNTAVAGTSSDGTSAQNIGFAIPIAQVESLIPQLLRGGAGTNGGGGYIGVDITTLTAALRQQYGLTPKSGVLVLDVLPGSPASNAGLQQGDVIVSIGGKAVASAETLQSIVQGDKPGQQIPVVYYRGTAKRTTSVTLGTQSQAQQQQLGG